MTRPSQARLDLQALRHNAALARKQAPRSQILAVVKANAYGHGAVTIAGALQSQVDAFAVACLEEALELRESGIAAPILLLQGVFEPTELETVAAHGLWLTIASERQLQWLEKEKLTRPLQCWLKIDTGMHRLGIQPAQSVGIHQRLLNCSNSFGRPTLCTHFACADEPGHPLNLSQIDTFENLCRQLPGPRSAANSAALLTRPQVHYDWVRPGYMLYGNSPLKTPNPGALSLRPVMTLASAVSSIRTIDSGESVGYDASWTARRVSKIATVPIGYGDGYPRTAASGTPVLVAGQQAALVGRVSMDMISIDVTDLPEVVAGDEVILWGSDLPVAEVAEHAGSSGYELLTRMPARLPRVVVAQ